MPMPMHDDPHDAATPRTPTSRLPDNLLMYVVLGGAALAYSQLDDAAYHRLLTRVKLRCGFAQDDPAEALAFWGHYVVSVVLYWAYAAVLTALEHFQRTRRSMAPYKIQPFKYSSPQQIWHAAKIVLLNQLVVNIPLGYLFYRGMLWRSVSLWDPLPSLPHVILQLAGFLAIEEIGHPA